ncbi:hypothetical protein DPMN_003729 [Dreissena polymorpha]|uniref:Uncharacterized protein n=1 Tax=Dreissena polymorpha TaxID=45954 RepID=A0A9D4MR92_DREPO|nr:hypothetical protein DPMN_003729 [Dreissena polymorpha]
MAQTNQPTNRPTDQPTDRAKTILELEIEVEVEEEVVVVAVVLKDNRKEITITCMSPFVKNKGGLRLAPGVDEPCVSRSYRWSCRKCFIGAPVQGVDLNNIIRTVFL